MRVFANVDEIIEHLEVLGQTTSAESDHFSELNHGLQCAALLERSNPDDVELQVAGLLHDLAHPWDSAGQPLHGEMGAAAVEPVMGSRIASLIAGHIPAKRYLVATREDYRALLSADSIMTLAAQGGAMSPDEIKAFEDIAHWEAMVALRVADDGAKVAGAVVPQLSHWVEAVRQMAEPCASGASNV
jgi:predicted HD phosphohydrolase